MSCDLVVDVTASPVEISAEAVTIAIEVDAAQPAIVLSAEPVDLIVDVAEASISIEVGVQGPPGPPGPEGPQGPPGIGIDSSDFREDEQLVGAINGANQVYSLPYGDTAITADPGLKIRVYLNGQRLHEGGANDYTTSESAPGGGVDLVTLIHVAPKPGDIVTADYVRDPP